jgi:hypothetical protein
MSVPNLVGAMSSAWQGYARDCVRLAQLAKSPELREQLMQMTREWMAVAMHESKMPEFKTLPA